MVFFHDFISVKFLSLYTNYILITLINRLMDWTRAGRELRQLADTFSRSKERKTVQKRAQALSMDALDYDNFAQLLQELFQVNNMF